MNYATDADGHIVLDDVTKQFGDVTAVDHVSLTIGKGEFFSLLGPSGCGKTTTLRMIAGFEEPTSGRILLEGADVTYVPAARRPVNMVFQAYALFPHMSVWENVAFGLKIKKVDRARGGRARGGGDADGPARGDGEAQADAALGRSAATRGACPGARQPARRRCSSTSRSVRST